MNIVADGLGAVVADTGGLVMLDDIVLVLLGVNIDLLGLCSAYVLTYSGLNA